MDPVRRTPKALSTPTWCSHSISVASRKSTQLPSTFDAHQKFEGVLNKLGSVPESSEGYRARKRLVININCQSHRTLQHQDRADRHNHAMCRPEPVHAHALFTAAKLDHAFVRSNHRFFQESLSGGTSHSRAFLQVIRKRRWSCTISRCRSAGNPSSWRTLRITTALVVSTMAISSSMEWLGVFPSCARSLRARVVRFAQCLTSGTSCPIAC